MGTTFNNLLIVQKMNFERNCTHCFLEGLKLLCAENKHAYYDVISLKIHFLRNQKIIEGGPHFSPFRGIIKKNKFSKCKCMYYILWEFYIGAYFYILLSFTSFVFKNKIRKFLSCSKFSVFLQIKILKKIYVTFLDFKKSKSKCLTF